MRVRHLYDLPETVAEAQEIQRRLRPMVSADTGGVLDADTVAGLDVAYDSESDRVAAAVVVMDARALNVIATATAQAHAAFPYVPGLLAFREVPPLVEALGQLTVTPDVLVCDGHGLAHPLRFGLACHIGVVTDLPTIGVAKTAFVGVHDLPARQRGAWTAISDGGEVVGRVLRTQTAVKPVFVSVGHRVSLDEACALVLRLCPRYRLPETTRRADQLSRQLLNRCASQPS
jgi:deoxyribonuclease V